MIETIRKADSRTYWKQWEGITCPALVVHAANSLPADHARLVAGRARRASVAEIADAGHDVHLEQPAEWRRVLTEFLAALP
jgi:pimeloyl-ACP methyl ester carboxylesterase